MTQTLMLTKASNRSVLEHSGSTVWAYRSDEEDEAATDRMKNPSTPDCIS